MQIDGVKLDTAVAPTNEISQPTPLKSQWLKSLIVNAPSRDNYQKMWNKKRWKEKIILDTKK